MAKIPSSKYPSLPQYILGILPGVILCILLGVLSWYISKFIPEQLFMINYVLIAIVLGALIRNFVLVKLKLIHSFVDGIDFSTKIFLMVGVVLLGARMDLMEVTAVGINALFMVAGSIALCIVLCGLIGKFSFGERTGHLIGAGIGVCGVSAIIALAPVIKSKEKELLLAIAAALMTDFMVLIGLPIIGELFNWGNVFSGYFAGVVPSNTAQSVAIGHAYSIESGAIATITKSARNALMPVVILVMAYVYTLRGLPVGETVRLGLLWEKFPKFVLGFLIGSLLATLNVFPANASSLFRNLYQWLFVFCFVGIGAGVDFTVFERKDLFPVILGFFMTFILGIYAFLWIRFIIGVS